MATTAARDSRAWRRDAVSVERTANPGSHDKWGEKTAAKYQYVGLNCPRVGKILHVLIEPVEHFRICVAWEFQADELG